MMIRNMGTHPSYSAINHVYFFAESYQISITRHFGCADKHHDIIRSLNVFRQLPDINLTVYEWHTRFIFVSNPAMLDGESTYKASKSIAKTHEKIYGSNIPLNNGFGRRIDLILATKNLELSTSEWKRNKTLPAKHTSNSAFLQKMAVLQDSWTSTK